MNVIPAKKRWFNVEKNTAPVFAARILDWNGNAITQSTLNSSGNKYTVFRLTDPNNEDTESAIAAHTDVALTVSSVVYDTLQKTAWWQDEEGNSIDDTGFNFACQPSIVTAAPFAVAGACYKLLVTLVPNGGEKILARWFVRCS